MSKLILVRHGDTELNSRERYWGQTDVKLSAAGFRQAERLRDRLATQNIDAIYSSNLQRASATAEIIAAKHQLTVTICTELGEINFGKLEGLTFEEISQRYPEAAKLWGATTFAVKFPGGESVDELNKRVSNFRNRLKKHAPEETILIVAHNAVLRLLMCQLLNLEMVRFRQFRIDLASLTILDTYPQQAIISLLNDVSHLE